MIILVGCLIVIGAWFYFVRQRGRQFLRAVAYTTRIYLQSDKEPEQAIEDFIHSMAFKMAASADVGTSIMTLWGADQDELVYQAASKARELYHSRADVWRRKIAV